MKTITFLIILPQLSYNLELTCLSHAPTSSIETFEIPASPVSPKFLARLTTDLANLSIIDRVHQHSSLSPERLDRIDGNGGCTNHRLNGTDALGKSGPKSVDRLSDLLNRQKSTNGKRPSTEYQFTHEFPITELSDLCRSLKDSNLTALDIADVTVPNGLALLCPNLPKQVPSAPLHIQAIQAEEEKGRSCSAIPPTLSSSDTGSVRSGSTITRQTYTGRRLRNLPPPPLSVVSALSTTSTTVAVSRLRGGPPAGLSHQSMIDTAETNARPDLVCMPPERMIHHLLDGLLPNTTYKPSIMDMSGIRLRVRAINAHGSGVYSGGLRFTTLTPLPAAPSFLLPPCVNSLQSSSSYASGLSSIRTSGRSSTLNCATFSCSMHSASVILVASGNSYSVRLQWSRPDGCTRIPTGTSATSISNRANNLSQSRHICRPTSAQPDLVTCLPSRLNSASEFAPPGPVQTGVRGLMPSGFCGRRDFNTEHQQRLIYTLQMARQPLTSYDN
ncbi:unnamed protein product [Protopolystoma xenopodis]|uniref:Fibronectin type-III domain-containing protein n=1 Tax=Protopolystoma xenopodis TaxID=117903 RepID=A0A448WMZ7_9PLAT|nr:unnamed protein product [Protopolystoma xenopodis]